MCYSTILRCAWTSLGFRHAYGGKWTNHQHLMRWVTNANATYHLDFSCLLTVTLGERMSITGPLSRLSSQLLGSRNVISPLPLARNQVDIRYSGTAMSAANGRERYGRQLHISVGSTIFLCVVPFFELHHTREVFQNYLDSVWAQNMIQHTYEGVSLILTTHVDLLLCTCLLIAITCTSIPTNYVSSWIVSTGRETAGKSYALTFPHYYGFIG